MKIVALDLGKSKMVGCVYESLTGVHRFDSAPLDRETLSGMLDSERPARVVIEIGASAGWVSDVVRGRGIELQVANASHEGWRWRNVKKKTDRIDALKLARLSAADQLPQVHVPAACVRQWRSLIRYRQQLIARRTAIKNRIRSILECEGLSMPNGRVGWSQAHMAKLREMAQPWEKVTPESLWRGELFEELAQYDHLAASIQRTTDQLDSAGKQDARVRRLQTIPGVGPRLAEAMTAIIDDPHRFRSGRQVSAYLGLVPRQFQSGQMDRQGRITGAGDRMLRALLIEVSWLALRHNSWARETFDRICRGNKRRRKTAIVAVARRLAVRCWAMLRDSTNWSPPTCAQAA